MKIFLLVSQILLGLGIMGLILIQKSKGGLGNAFGGEAEFHSRRGAEQIVFRSTIIFSTLFLIVSILNLLIK
jgi:protein translocase SecG subunit